MALTEATTTWQSVTLENDEVWIVEKGVVKLHCDGAAPDNEDGGSVHAHESIRFSSGLTVYYKTAHGSGEHKFARVRV